MIYWDLDGVVRDLVGPIMEQPVHEWFQKTKANKSVVETVDDDLMLLESAAPTIYYDVANKLQSIIFITSQKESWRPHTDKWIARYFGGKATTFYVNKPAEKLAYLKYDDYLVEDYPLFAHNDKIILIDKKYNSRVADAYERITTPEQLENLLKKLGELK